MFHEPDDDIFVVEPDNDMVPLDSQDPELIRGVEIGYMLCSALYGFDVHMKIHTSNIEMLMRIADSFEMTFSSEDTEEDPDIVIVTLCSLDNGEFSDDDDF